MNNLPFYILYILFYDMIIVKTPQHQMV